MQEIQELGLFQDQETPKNSTPKTSINPVVEVNSNCTENLPKENPTIQKEGVVKKSFVAHANLVYQAMTRQAGTLGKAILEGVMNSIDAKATKVEITLNQTEFIITDDGTGMNTENEVNEYFRTLGTPHETDETGTIKDAKYGEYRMGRGQIFAQGISRWRTGPFELLVDLKTWGLDFEQRPNPDDNKGCSILTTLYNPLSIADLQSNLAETKRFCKYVEIPVFLNGKQINTPPKDKTWTKEDDIAYYQIEKSDHRQTGVELYQQGVYVERIPTWQDGLNGVVVTKNRMTLNFARNQAMRDCPVYKAVAKTLKGFGEKTAKTKKNLSQSERIATILRAEGNYNNKAFQKQLVFEDIQGRAWSSNTLTRAVSKYQTLPDGSVPLSFAQPGDRKADKIMQQKQGIVLSLETLRSLEIAGIEVTQETFIQTFLSYRAEKALTYVELDLLTEKISESYHLIDPNKLTPKETRVIKILKSICDDLSYIIKGHSRRNHTRELRVGTSETAQGWTDGETYIAIERDFLKRNLSGTPQDFGNLVLLLIHEQCHDEPDSQTHVHSPEFYKSYHDTSKRSPYLTMKAFISYISELEKDGKTLPANLQKVTLKMQLADHVEEIQELEEESQQE